MIEYHPIEEGDLPEIISLYTTHLNSGDSFADTIREAWEQGVYAGYKAVGEDGKIGGLMTLREGVVFTYPHPALERELDKFLAGRSTYCCDALLVLPDYRKEGIAHYLATKSRELLRGMGVECFLSEIWLYPNGGPPATETFESMGKVIWQKRIPMFYSELARYGMGCPICGAECVCGAWVDVMEL